MSAFFQEMRESEPASIFTLSTKLPHQLSESTLLNNYGASHLINTQNLLIPSSFRVAELGDRVEVGTTSFLIIRRGT